MASGLKSALEQEFADIRVVLKEVSGGTFDVFCDQEKIYSKGSFGRFPEHAEIISALKARTPSV